MLLNQVLITSLIGFLSLPCLSADTSDTLKKEAYFVIGSTRQNLLQNIGVLACINGHESDCSHTNTYGGQATTFDCDECKDKHQRHIVGDATTFDFSDFNIKAAYLERLPTILSVSTTPEEASINNLIGAVIKNLAAHMDPGARIEIELDPFLKFFFKDIEKARLEEFIEENPFHAWHNYFVAYNLLISLSNEQFDPQIFKQMITEKEPGYSEETIERIISERNELKDFIENLAKKAELDLNDLSLRLKQEMIIYDNLVFTPEPYGFKNVVSLFPRVSSLDFRDFNASFESKRFGFVPSEFLQDVLRNDVQIRPDASGELREFWFYDASFFNNSLSNRVLSMYAVEKNQPFIIKFLESAGFENVQCDITTSPHNGRKNVWIISATKKD